MLYAVQLRNRRQKINAKNAAILPLHTTRTDFRVHTPNSVAFQNHFGLVRRPIPFYRRPHHFARSFFFCVRAARRRRKADSSVRRM